MSYVLTYTPMDGEGREAEKEFSCAGNALFFADTLSGMTEDEPTVTDENGEEVTWASIVS